MSGGQADWSAIARLGRRWPRSSRSWATVTSGPLATRCGWSRRPAATGVVVGRGCLGRPLARSANWPRGSPERLRPPEPRSGEVLAVLRRHAELLAAMHDDELKGCRDIRKHMAWYLKGFRVAQPIRAALGTVGTLAELDDLLSGIDPAQPYPSMIAAGPRGADLGPASGRPARGVAGFVRAGQRRGPVDRRDRRQWRVARLHLPCHVVAQPVLDVFRQVEAEEAYPRGYAGGRSVLQAKGPTMNQPVIQASGLVAKQVRQAHRCRPVGPDGGPGRGLRPAGAQRRRQVHDHAHDPGLPAPHRRDGDGARGQRPRPTHPASDRLPARRPASRRGG